MQIDIDFEVFKELTARRGSESISYNDVIRELLGLAINANSTAHVDLGRLDGAGYSYRGLFLPDGTKLRAIYKRQLHTAEIRNGRFRDKNGVEHASPSGAARHITGNTVNGLRFWEAMRPGDAKWHKLDTLTANAL